MRPPDDIVPRISPAADSVGVGGGVTRKRAAGNSAKGEGFSHFLIPTLRLATSVRPAGSHPSIPLLETPARGRGSYKVVR